MQKANPRLLRGRAEVISLSSSPTTEVIHQTFGKAVTSRVFLLRWVSLNVFLITVLSLSGFAPRSVTEMGAAIASTLDPVPFSEHREDNRAPAYDTFAVEKPQIVIPAIDTESVIIEPKEQDIAILNAALARGAVRYPGSAGPGEIGNLFIFGHSSELPVVHNKAYKVFNRAKELEAGDAIKVREDSREYLYIVKSVSVRRASEAAIHLETPKKLLTLVTCRLIGASEDQRYVIEAEFLRSYPLRIRT